MRTPTKTRMATVIAALLLAAPLLTTGPVQAADAPQAATAAAADTKASWYPKRADLAFVKQHAVVPKRDDVTIVDSRPAARKYDLGHIPTAVNIPDTAFDKLAPELLPKDKAQLLVFYCDGLECILSHSSAFKAEKLGYTNIRVYAEGYPEWVKAGNLAAVSPAFIKKQLDEKAPMTLVDARPKERKYDKGHIPGAISLPDAQFDKLAGDLLPKDKAAALYFYCDGLACVLSNDSAAKAVKLGYSNVKVVPEGYPGWEKAYGPGPTGGAAQAAQAPAMVAGKEAGSITNESFERIYKEAPSTIHLVDVRGPAEFAAGTFKGAVNMPLDTLEKNLAKLPTDKPIVFFCGAGSRSGEAYDMVKLYRPELKAAFLDTTIKFSKDGSYTLGAKS